MLLFCVDLAGYLFHLQSLLLSTLPASSSFRPTCKASELKQTNLIAKLLTSPTTSSGRAKRLHWINSNSEISKQRLQPPESTLEITATPLTTFVSGTGRLSKTR